MRRTLALLFATALTATACTSGAPTGGQAGTAARAVELMKVGTTQDESSWNPWTYSSGIPGWPVVLLQFDTLMNFDLNSETQPWLAKEVAASADSRVWTMTLQSGVKWHDGRAFTADDVKFTYEMFQKIVHGRFSAPVRDIEKIEVTGADKVVVTLKSPRPGWRTQALADIPIMPKHIWEPQLASNPDPKKFTDLKGNIGTGPYQLVEYKQDQVYRFRANAEYFKGKPLVNEIVMPIVKDANATFSAVKTGELDTTVRPLQPELVKDFEATAGMKVARGPEFGTHAIFINAERPGLDRKEVRQAIDLAVDKKRLIDTVFLGTATIGSPGFIHPENPFANKSLAARYDVAKGNQLLDSIGATKGADGIRSLGGRRLAYEMLIDQTRGPLAVRMAELASQMIKDVGIQVTVKSVERNTWVGLVWPEFNVAKGRNFDLSMHGWSAPTQFEAGRLVDLFHSDPIIGQLNVGGFKDRAGDELGMRLANEGDAAKRRQLAAEVQAYIADQLPLITVAYPDGLYAYKQATFDAWKFQKGLGVFQKNTFLPQ
jgi:peptide/nickel transport system substrate-binding protein